MLRGTPGYIAPDIYRHHPATEKTDVFAAGVLLEKVMFGKTPFTSLSNEAICVKMNGFTLDEHWAFLEHLGPCTAMSLEQAQDLRFLVYEMMAPRPEDRPTMAEAHAEFRRIFS